MAIVRLEQLYPFPSEALARQIHALRPKQVVWLQEEPRNFGAWAWLRDQLADLSPGGRVACVARPPSASPAGSFHTRHDEDQMILLREALGVGRDA